MIEIKPNHPKRFGQHFLHDVSYIQRIVDAADIKPWDCFIEIGPGGGALTEHVLPLVNRLIAIEIDPILCRGLAAKFSHWESRFCLHHADALAINLSDLIELTHQEHIRLIGNLPYNIATPLLFHWLKEKRIQDLHIMVQKEVADRLVAVPGSKAYSRLSVMVQYYGEVSQLFRVKSGAFYPPPKVESAVIRVIQKKNISYPVHNERWFAKVVKTAFNQRRKTIANSLASLKVTATLLEDCHISPKARAEVLTIDDYVRLSNRLYAITQATGS